MLNIPNPSPVKVNGEELPTTENFTYLGSTVMHDGGAGSDIRNRLNKFKDALRMLNNVRKSAPSRALSNDCTKAVYFPPYCTAQNAGA